MFLSNEIMFYGGIIVMISSLILLFLYHVFSRIFITKMKKKLNDEYGEEVKNVVNRNEGIICQKYSLPLMK